MTERTLALIKALEEKNKNKEAIKDKYKLKEKAKSLTQGERLDRIEELLGLK